MTPHLIGLDWGTSSLRAYLVGRGGAVMSRRESGHGLRALPDGGFAAAFAAAVADWPAALPVVMSGMVGSRAGWREAPYAEIGPHGVGPEALARQLLDMAPHTRRPAWIVPGVATRGDGGPDVMRGEETQVLALSERPDGLFLLPGTHSKWVRVAGGRITGFRTAMTGEVFAALSRHTILADTAAEPADAAEAEQGFDDGVAGARTLERPGDLLHRLFSIRAATLFEELPAGRSRDYLSGLLIGAEIAAEAGREPVCLIGAPALAARYGRALHAFGIDHETAPPDVAARGLHNIALAAKLITEETTC